MQPALAQAHTASNSFSDWYRSSQAEPSAERMGWLRPVFVRWPNVGGAMFTRVQAYLARDRERRDRIVEGRQFRLRQERERIEREIDEGHIHGDACELCPLDCAD
jgi:hypothetical protein